MDDETREPQSAGGKHACVPCYSRKVKCDRQHPCTTCQRTNADCVYREPAPPRRKKRMTEKDFLERITQYEDHLRRAGISLDKVQTENSASQQDESAEESALRDANTPEKSSARPGRDKQQSRTGHLGEKPAPETGKMVTDAAGHSRYVESNLWVSLHDEFKKPGGVVEDAMVESSSDDDMQNSNELDPNYVLFSDGHALKKDLTAFFPLPDEANFLWQTYIKNIAPIVKVIHIPSFSRILHQSQQNPQSASTSVLLLIYSMFELATVSLDEALCEQNLKQSKSTVEKRYRFLTQHALVKSQFLRSNDLTVLQAFFHHLCAMRLILDSYTLWAYTGIAMRIARRIGLHRDGTQLGLRPFDVEMRRRLWLQLVMLDVIASELAGLQPEISGNLHNAWDTFKPSNLNDSDLDPNMTELPPDRVGATEMMFCLLRYEFGAFFKKTGLAPNVPIDPASQEAKGTLSFEEKDRLIDSLQKNVEEKFLKFCDPLEPLHHLVSVAARAAATAIRLRAHHPRQYKALGIEMPQSVREMLFTSSVKILSYFNLIHTNQFLQRFVWHTRAHSQWHALIYCLSELRERTTGEQVEQAWENVFGLFRYSTHVLINPKHVLHTAIINLTLKAWSAREAALKNLGVSYETPPVIAEIREIEEKLAVMSRNKRHHHQQQHQQIPQQPPPPYSSSPGPHPPTAPSATPTYTYPPTTFLSAGTPSTLPPHLAPTHAVPEVRKQALTAFDSIMGINAAQGPASGLLPPGSFTDPAAGAIDWAQWDNLVVSSDMPEVGDFDFDSLFWPPSGRIGGGGFV